MLEELIGHVIVFAVRVVDGILGFFVRDAGAPPLLVAL